MGFFGKDSRQKPGASERAGTAQPQTTSHDEARRRKPGSSKRRAGTAGAAKMASIGKSIQIKGDLTGEEDLQVDGLVEGRIDLPKNQLLVGSEGTVKADLQAKTIIVVGHVTGNVKASECINIEDTGVVDGDVEAPRLVIQEGAVLNGSVAMVNETKPKSAPLTAKLPDMEVAPPLSAKNN